MNETEVTKLLRDWQSGDAGALDELVPRIYGELRRMARGHLRREGARHTWQTTELLHEVYLRLVGADISWQDRAHFFAVAATTMRRLLVDHARSRARAKRGGGARKLTLDENLVVDPARLEELVEIDDALTRLAEQDERKAKVVELHYFGGMPYEEIAEVLHVSLGTVRRDMRLSKAWLRKEMT
jgi:RNA polymerase sigma factor (TIGR02999 family)